MSDPILTLEYEMTVYYLRRRFERFRPDMRRMCENLNMLMAANAMAMSAVMLYRRDGGSAVLFMACGGVMAVIYPLVTWWTFRSLEKKLPRWLVQIEIDEQGVRVRSPRQKTTLRCRWSKLTGVDEHDGGFEMMFDGVGETFFNNRHYAGVMIPASAFETEAKREQLRSLIVQHLPKPALAAAA